MVVFQVIHTGIDSNNLLLSGKLKGYGKLKGIKNGDAAPIPHQYHFLLLMPTVLIILPFIIVVSYFPELENSTGFGLFTIIWVILSFVFFGLIAKSKFFQKFLPLYLK